MVIGSMKIKPRWVLTRHALERAVEMGLSRADIVAVLDDPENDYPGDPRYDRSRRRIATRGALDVVYEPQNRLVVTVLFHGREGR